jgi:filamentous hemagglutinin family protein
MHKIHPVIWRASTAGLALAATLAMGCATALAAPPANLQLPSGGQVVAGSASISQSGAALTVQQNSQRAALDWQTFNIGSQASVHFEQPVGGVALNRIADTNASQIYGQLSATGQVFLSNPNGLYFAPGASVNVGGLVATTHSIGLADFMAGKTSFERKGASGSVVNEGELKAALGGYIALLAPEVRNLGVVVAHLGTVALAAGEAFDLQFDANYSLAALRVTPSTIQALVDNQWAVLAPGGLILLSAHAVERVRSGVMQNSGRMEATGLQLRGGRIVLDASDAIENAGSILATASTSGPAGSVTLQASGKVVLEGVLDVSASGVDPAADGPTGGQITVAAAQIDVRSARLDASGSHGGAITLDVSGSATVATVEFDTPATFTSPTSPTSPTAPLPAPKPGQLALTGNTQLASRGRQGAGGTVTLLGDYLSLNDSSAIDATGANGGGRVLVGGDWQGSGSYYQATSVSTQAGVHVDASATLAGPGGKVMLWSDVLNPSAVTAASGTVVARGGALGGDGGQVETSGHSIDIDGLRVDTRAANSLPGKSGLWLIDPYSYTINSGQAAILVGSLATSDITIATAASNLGLGSSGNPADTGDITVNSAIVTSGAGAGALTLLADRDIILNAGITLSGTNKALTLSAKRNVGTSNSVGVMSLTTNNGAIQLYADSGASQSGSLDLDNLRLNAGAGNVTIRGYTMGWGAPGPVINSTGAFTFEPSGASFGQAVATSYFTIGSTLTGYTFGKAGNAAAIYVDTAQTVAGPISLYGGNLAINGAVTATGSNTIALSSSGNVTQTAALTADKLELLGGNVTLSHVGNNVSTLAASGVGALTYANSDALTLGAVGASTGVSASGVVVVETLAGDLSVAESVVTTDTSATALTLNAGKAAAAGTAAGGNILVAGGKSVQAGAGGTARLYSGSVAGSTGLTALVGSGSGRFRYHGDESASHFTTTLGAGLFAVYREQPTASLAVRTQTVNYGDSITLSDASSGLVNGDAAT